MRAIQAPVVAGLGRRATQADATVSDRAARLFPARVQVLRLGKTCQTMHRFF